MYSAKPRTIGSTRMFEYFGLCSKARQGLQRMNNPSPSYPFRCPDPKIFQHHAPQSMKSSSNLYCLLHHVRETYLMVCLTPLKSSSKLNPRSTSRRTTDSYPSSVASLRAQTPSLLHPSGSSSCEKLTMCT